MSARQERRTSACRFASYVRLFWLSLESVQHTTSEVIVLFIELNGFGAKINVEKHLEILRTFFIFGTASLMKQLEFDLFLCDFPRIPRKRNSSKRETQRRGHGNAIGL